MAYLIRVKASSSSCFQEKKRQKLRRSQSGQVQAERIDVTEPDRDVLGVKHPITQTIDEMVDIFRSADYTFMRDRTWIPSTTPSTR